MDQCTTGNFGWVSREDQFQRQRFHCFFDGVFAQFRLVFQFAQGAGDHFRVAGSFAFRRNAVVLLGGVGQVQELTKRTRNGQQLVVRQIL
ncbi:Uncharacterised protein [Shigella sonnei]|nr:Uncharacterised protein [Shigella sonnei]CSF12838.1 Uncharacterised protein [Shigella sonnei]CSF26992.1 Uncharacterised protein [Shigella sonnei]CSF33938.1 Uncharacterised protein [Shigella sonnei]CSF80986.1 Uncharacterised protein [Shigella sonnei]